MDIFIIATENGLIQVPNTLQGGGSPKGLQKENLFFPIRFVSHSSWTWAVASSSMLCLPLNPQPHLANHHINSQDNTTSILLEGDQGLHPKRERGSKQSNSGRLEAYQCLFSREGLL